MRKITLYLLMLMIGAACKERYELPHSGPPTGYLVIDGVINSGQGPTTLRISRTLALVDSVAFRHERGANVRVEGEDNSIQQLIEVNDGVYHSDQLTLLDNVKYRLHINAEGGKEYISDYVPVMRTPPIDGISWERPEDGVEIFINTHDPQNKTLYYRWEYEETWEFHSPFYSTLIYERDSQGLPYDVDPRDVNESQQMYVCYAGGPSTNLLLGSSVKLSRDTIHLPIMFIPKDHWKLSVLYSIKVRQYAVSRAGYEFLQRMKKNTEQVGSLFDAQPSELVGNIKSVTNPNEPVIGFVDIADAQESRIFIRRADVLPWNYGEGCIEDTVDNHPDSLALFAGHEPTMVAELSPLGDTLKIFAALKDCVDCRLRGTPVKPSFWP